MQIPRRTFGRGLAVAGAAALSKSRPASANERIGVGIIGCGGKGQELWKNFLAQPDVDAVAVSDVYAPFLEKGVAMSGGKARPYKDFRKLLEDKDVDAVIIGTPDHWHALQTVMACRAGKDVYVEKPLALTIKEGRTMVTEARRTKRVVQVGSQQRSGAHYQKAFQLIRDGAIGKVHKVSAGFARNAMPGFQPKKMSITPQNLDWEMWLGPAPKVPFDPFRGIYHFRWFWDYSGGQMTNWGAHHLDIVRWVLGAPGPQTVAGFGGRFAVKDGGETPDVQEIIYQFKDCVVTWSAREMNKGRGVPVEFHGTKGTLSISRSGFQVSPEVWGGEVQGTGENLGGKDVIAAMDEKGAPSELPHIRDFLDCVKSRKKPIADVEEGHLSAVVCHLGNIAMRLGRSLKWDATKEEIVGDRDANRWLTKPYRRPWSLDVA